jgi:ubiquinone/menaquinone biosynthesis C-methylase UbiE
MVALVLPSKENAKSSENMAESKVREQYNYIASVYDRRWSKYITNTLSFLKSWASIPPQASVLDVACGTGELEQMILAENPTQKMVGVDISEKMLTIAQQKCSNSTNVSFQVASASALPFPHHHFDVVVSANAFHYFDHPEAALSEIRRVLQPNGSVVILDWCKDYLLCRIFDAVLQFFDPAHKQCYTQAEFHQLLTSAGFRLDRATKVRFGFLWGLMIATAVPR